MSQLLTLTQNEAITQALHEEMARDSRVLMFGEGVATTRPDLLQAFGPERVRNTPLAEAIIAGTAVGAAASGLRPVIDLLYAPFLTYAMDALVNSAGKLRYLSGGQFNFPLVVLAQTGAGWGVGAQHSHNLEAWFAHVPGLKIAFPSNPADAKGLLKAAIRDDNPVLMFLDMPLGYVPGAVPAEPEQTLVPLGRASTLRVGRDITLVSYGKTVATCLDAAKQLEADGVSAEVIDLRSLKPLDSRTVLNSVRKTGRLVVVHEAGPMCGIGAEVIARVAEEGFEHLRAPARRITSPDVPTPAAHSLEAAFVPSAAAVRSTALRLCEGVAVL
ncbi:alpha-ketoacid dehydrogenase subunit beta [Inhella proteolytica]|uniref:Alpha-ketoacid dehydrogenase subunit beta n=1 Tax=Inhella proteolytica TaxID=2795029 RepID=A0A931J689_9BURK|nr:alpha-ketoacid dehydrogenase subunit beta [Inhella proteolytica]MBH9576930.1 alpha-ketoacid dehydrogenase subunit beta [Inhella proteolytica]